MERRVSMKRRFARLSILVAIALMAQVSWADHAVVLITDKDSPIEHLSMLDIRKTYLGITVTVEGKKVRALRRRDDERLNQIFLQSVIAMSVRSYERRLLSLALKDGTPRPKEVSGWDELLESIANDPHSIGYAWKIDAESNSRIKIIKVLWQEP